MNRSGEVRVWLEGETERQWSDVFLLENKVCLVFIF